MIPSFELKTQYLQYKELINGAIQKVLESGTVILGEEVEKFENTFSSYVGKKFGVGVGSGTDALLLSLVCAGIQPGDEVITVANTAYETVSPIVMLKAVPVFCDIDHSMNMDVSKVEQRITSKTRAIIPVHLYGNPMDMVQLMQLADHYGLTVIEDCAQAAGAEFSGKKAGSFGHFSCFSFYPTKNLGTYGDGGMILTHNEEHLKTLRMLRCSGQSDRYTHKIKGFTTRLDEIHAAILNVKLAHLDRWNERRRSIAAQYHSGIRGPELPVETGKHVYHQYILRSDRRDDLKESLARRGITTLIHYPTPLHRQEAFGEYAGYDLPVTETTARRILSLPMYPELLDENVEKVIAAVNAFFC